MLKFTVSGETIEELRADLKELLDLLKGKRPASTAEERAEWPVEWQMAWERRQAAKDTRRVEEADARRAARVEAAEARKAARKVAKAAKGRQRSAEKASARLKRWHAQQKELENLRLAVSRSKTN